MKTKFHEKITGSAIASGFFFIVVMLSSIPAFAGYISGLNVVWVNLDHSADGRRVDEEVKRMLSGNSALVCDGFWDPSSALLYMIKRPPSIDDRLVEDIFIK